MDNALSPVVAAGLRRAGHDASHVRDYGMQTASDANILARAEEERRTIVSADTDFGALLALHGRSRPSFILFRRSAPRDPGRQVDVLLENLPQLGTYLDEGSVVVIEGTRLRIRSLPIHRPVQSGETPA